MKRLLAGLIALCVVLAACSADTAGPGTAEPGTAEPDASATLEGDPADERYAWFQTESTESAETDDLLTGITLRVGYRDGTTTGTFPLPIDFQLKLPSLGIGFITGPTDGVVAISLDDGEESVIELIDVASGEQREVFRTDDAVTVGALHRSGKWIFLVRVARDSGAATMARLDLPEHGDASIVELAWLEEPTPSAMEMFDLLRFTPDGSRLVIQRCPADECSYRVVSIADGSVSDLSPAGTGRIVGLTDTALLAEPASWGMTKEFRLVDLATGELIPVELTGQAATLVRGEAGPLVVLEEGRPGRTSYVVVDPATGARRPLNVQGGPPPSDALVPGPERQGLVPPPGWVVFGDEARISIDGPADAAPLLVEVETGRTIPFTNLR